MCELGGRGQGMTPREGSSTDPSLQEFREASHPEPRCGRGAALMLAVLPTLVWPQPWPFMVRSAHNACASGEVSSHPSVAIALHPLQGGV